MTKTSNIPKLYSCGKIKFDELRCVIFFFLEHAGELRIFVLREKGALVQITESSSSPWTRERAAETSKSYYIKG